MIDLTIKLERGDAPLDMRFDTQSGVTGLFGPSGAGKTTILHCIAGLEKPDAGRIAVKGRVLYDSAEGVSLPAHARRIGVVFQDGRLFPHLTAQRNLQYGMRRSLQASSAKRFDEIIELMRLNPLLERYPHQLSGGEQQRICIGRAVLSDPDMLLLDEPLTGLDRRHRDEVIAYLNELVHALGIPVLYVTHDLSELLQLTDQLILVANGRVLATGEYLDLLQEARVDRVAFSGQVTNVIPMTIRKHDAAVGSSMLITEQSGSKSVMEPVIWHVPLTTGREGEQVTATFGANEVALSLARLEDSSIQNQVPGTVTRICDRSGWSVVEIDAGVRIVAQVGQASVARLKLVPGREVYCLIKASAILTPSRR